MTNDWRYNIKKPTEHLFYIFGKKNYEAIDSVADDLRDGLNLGECVEQFCIGPIKFPVYRITITYFKD